MSNDTTNKTVTRKSLAFTSKEEMQKIFDDLTSNFPADFMKQTEELETYARDFGGDENSEARRSMLALIFDVKSDEVLKTKAGVIALATALSATHTKSEATLKSLREKIMAKPKTEVEGEKIATEAETMALELTNNLAGAVEVSEALRNLSPENISKVVALSHATTISFFKHLSTKANPFPDSAKNLINYLLAASKGDWSKEMAFTDKFIAEQADVNPKTIQRARADLRQFMAKSGKGIVEISTRWKKDKDGKDTAKPESYVYKIPFLKTVATQIVNLFNSEKGEAENILLVSTISNALTLPEADRPKLNLSPEAIKKVQELDSAFKTMIEDLPAPNEEVREGERKRKIQVVLDKFAPLRTELGAIYDELLSIKKPKTAKNVDLVVREIRAEMTQIEDNGKEFSQERFDYFTKETESYRGKLDAFRKALANNAQAEVEKEREETGQVTPQTLRQMAQANAELAVNQKTVKEDYEQYLAEFEETCFNFAELCKVAKVKTVQIVPTLHAYIAEAFGLTAPPKPEVKDETPAPKEGAKADENQA